MTAEILLAQLEKHKEIGKSRWVAVCPAHQDRTPSLHIEEKSDGVVLIHCKAGCGAADVLEAVNLPFSALFPEDHYSQRSRRYIPKDTEDNFVVELWNQDRAAGKPASEADKKRFREALMRGGKPNGFVKTVQEAANTPLPSDTQRSDLTTQEVQALIAECDHYLSRA